VRAPHELASVEAMSLGATPCSTTSRSFRSLEQNLHTILNARVSISKISQREERTGDKEK
jgi:hypothetical protein